jgi:hypothetical protein
VIVIGIFAAWAIPYWQAMRGANLAQTWSVQLTGRLTGDDFKLGSWLLNIPRALAYFLPWTLLLPWVRGAELPSPRETNLLRALTFGCGIPFLVVNLLPGALPRYSMPVLVPASWLMAMTLTSEIRPPAWWPAGQIPPTKRRLRLVIYTAIVAGIAIGLYAVAIVPSLQRRSKVKSIAAQIDGLVPDSEPLYAVDPDYQPFLFYIRSRVVYVSRIDDLPLTAQYLLIQPEKERPLMESDRWAPLHARPILTVTDYRRRTVILAKVGDRIRQGE